MSEWIEQLKQALLQVAELLGNRDFTEGTLLLLAGCIGIAVSIVALLVCLAAFPRKRRKLLKRLENMEE